MFDRISRVFNAKKDGRDGYTKWSNRIIEISDFILKNNRLPKANNNDKNEHNLYQSFSANKRKFYSKELSEKQLNFLELHTIVFENLSSIDTRDGYTRWSNRIIEISDFILKNNRLPKANNNDKNEYNLYQSFSANKRKFISKQLSDKQLNFLEYHNIILENSTSISDRWNNVVLEISDFIIKNEHYPKANRKDVNEEKLYHALARIRRAKEKDKLSVEQSDFLDQNNIILENNISISDKWKMKVLEISDFITTNEHYPKANRKDVNEEKLYHALARIRRAKEKDKLSVEQSDFLDQNNIILENNISISDKWNNKVLEISDFIAKNDHYPKSNKKGSDEEKLYHALNRIRRADEKGQLSDLQLEFLEQNNIVFKKDIYNKLNKEDILKIKRVYSDNPFMAFDYFKEILITKRNQMNKKEIKNLFEEIVNN